MTTTQRVYIDDMATINKWIVALGYKSFAELIHQWVLAVDRHKKQEFYSRLSPIQPNINKKLSGCKIDKSRICTQENGAT